MDRLEIARALYFDSNRIANTYTALLKQRFCPDAIKKRLPDYATNLGPFYTWNIFSHDPPDTSL
jgi:hypothetical protein